MAWLLAWIDTLSWWQFGLLFFSLCGTLYLLWYCMEAIFGGDYEC